MHGYIHAPLHAHIHTKSIHTHTDASICIHDIYAHIGTSIPANVCSSMHASVAIICASTNPYIFTPARPYIHMYIHAPCSHTSMHPWINTSLRPCIQTSGHPLIHMSIHPYAHGSTRPRHPIIHAITRTHVHAPPSWLEQLILQGQPPEATQPPPQPSRFVAPSHVQDARRVRRPPARQDRRLPHGGRPRAVPLRLARLPHRGLQRYIYIYIHTSISLSLYIYI